MRMLRPRRLGVALYGGHGHDHDAGRKMRRIVPVRMTSKVSIHVAFSERASANSGRKCGDTAEMLLSCCRTETPLTSFVERVEKPTDNRPARLLCSLAANADSLGDRPVVGPGASPTPLPRWGQCCFDGSPNPVLSVSGGDRTRRNTPSREETSRRRPTSSPRRTARTKSYARPIGHSAFRGPKSGRQCEYCGSVAIRRRRPPLANMPRVNPRRLSAA